LLKNFAAQTEHHPGEPVWEVMRMIGSDLVKFITNLRSKLNEVSKFTEVWNLKKEGDEFKILFLPRINSLPDDASDVLGYQVRSLGLEDEIIAILSPDSRGDGYGMRRYNDDTRMDFCKLENESDVHFTHARGFIAKTSAVDKGRLQEMLIQSFHA